MFYKNKDKSCTMTDLYLNHNISFGYEDSYNYYGIDVDKILLFVKSDNEYIIRYNSVNKNKIVPLQLKANNFYLGESHMLPNDITIALIHSDDKELFRKCREIWNKINNLIGINNFANFVVTNLDGRDDFIILKLEKKTIAIRDKYRNDLVFVLHSVFNDYFQASLVQYRYVYRNYYKKIFTFFLYWI